MVGRNESGCRNDDELLADGGAYGKASKSAAALAFYARDPGVANADLESLQRPRQLEMETCTGLRPQRCLARDCVPDVDDVQRFGRDVSDRPAAVSG